MKISILLLLGMFAGWPLSVRADSTVVFNEIMYHPVTNETALEWVELFNQQAVDMDISDWSLANAIDFTFPEGTIIPGGGYVVLALSPEALRAPGVSNVFGPFAGRLGNSGEKLELRNNNQRLVDAVNYGVEGVWPSGPDGAGVSLAKRDPNFGSASPASWRMSAQTGGTPGHPNFPVVKPGVATLVPFNQIWKFNQTGTDLGSGWRQPGYDDGLWPSGPGLLGSEIAALAQPLRTQLTLGPTTFYFRTHFEVSGDPLTSTLILRHILDDGMILYLNGVEVYRLGLPADPIFHSTFANRGVGDAVPEGPFTLPAEALVSGDNLLAVEVHQTSPGSSDIVFGLTLELSTAAEPAPSTPALEPQLAFNEISSSTNAAEFWLEFINHGPANIELAGKIIALLGGGTNREYALPAQTLSSGALIQFSNAALNFVPDSGQLLALYSPGRTSVIDVVVLKKNVRARHPDGIGPWLFPRQPTPGQSNLFVSHNEIVINEIMYHARDLPPVPGSSTVAPLPWRDSPESWIELYNRGDAAVDLTSWRLDTGIDYRFPAGTTLPAGGYLVIAKDPSHLRALHPAINILGPFTNNLSRKSDYLILKDAENNPADEVRYFDRGRWPSLPDGGGSGLELRDPWADNTKPEAWAASTEGGKSSWSNYLYRAIAAATPGPAYWNELVMGLLDAGECLVDEIHVVESPATTKLELLQNGSFENGAVSWRFLGTHKESRVIIDPENAANHVLHLIATGPTEHMHNHLETTFAGNRPLVSGREYEISFRAKWLAGNNRLNTRLYFNRLARTSILPVPALTGTPGGPNSTYATNIGPTFAGFGHTPIVPQPNQAVTVTIAAFDPQGVAACTLRWSTNSTSWSSSEMAFRNGTYAAAIPGFSAGTIIQFYIEAADSLGAISTYPAAGRESRALYVVNDNRAVRGRLHDFRIIVTKGDADWLHARTNVMSNAKLKATVVYNESEAFYNVGLKLQGSEHGRFEDNRVGFTIDFDPDHLFRGAQENVTIDRSSWRFQGGPQEEILLKHMINHAGGLPGMYDDLVHVITPRAVHTGTGLMLMAKYGQDFLDSAYPMGSDSSLFKLELIYPLSATVDGNPESQKIPQSGGDYVGSDIRNLGVNKEIYRHFFLIENQQDHDDYSLIMSLASAFSTTGQTLETQTRQLMDVDEWMRAFAFEALGGVSDTFHYDNPHNFMIYFRPEDRKALAFLWDMDFAFHRPVNEPFPGTASPNVNKIMSIPAYRRAYFGHLDDIMRSTYNAAYISRWTDHYGGLLGQNWSGILNYIQQRANYVKAALPGAVPFAITANGGNDFNTGLGAVTLSGTAPSQVKHLEINGVLYEPSWITITNWTLIVPTTDRTNNIILHALGYNGNLLTNTVDTVTIINTNAAPSAATLSVVINEWMADNAGPAGLADPADGLFQDWFELYNPNSNPYDLSGHYLTDDLAMPAKWRVPDNTLIPPNAYLLVWADDETAQNGAGNSDLHANFKLSADGEVLALFAPDAATLRHAVTFGTQAENVSQGWFPEGNTNEIFSMTNATPRAANTLAEPPPPLRFIDVSIVSGQLALQWQAVPGRIYTLEFKENLSDQAWSVLARDIPATGNTASATDHLNATHRLYRIALQD